MDDRPDAAKFLIDDFGMDMDLKDLWGRGADGIACQKPWPTTVFLDVFGIEPAALCPGAELAPVVAAPPRDQTQVGPCGTARSGGRA